MRIKIFRLRSGAEPAREFYASGEVRHVNAYRAEENYDDFPNNFGRLAN